MKSWVDYVDFQYQYLESKRVKPIKIRIAGLAYNAAKVVMMSQVNKQRENLKIRRHHG